MVQLYFISDVNKIYMAYRVTCKVVDIKIKVAF